MSLYKRGETYWCEWQVSGQRIRETTGTTDKQAAQEYHDRRRAELWREVKLGDIRVSSWDEAALQWVTEHAQYKKSYDDDRLRLIWLTEKLTRQPITSISTDVMLEIRKDLMETRAASTANRFLAIISAVLNYAHDKGKLDAVPSVPYLKEERQRFRWLTREQATALIAELPDHLAAMTRFALATGLRRANITGLTWDAVDAVRRIAWVWPDEAKAGKQIPVHLNNDALEVIKCRIGTHKKYVFTYRGKPIFHTTTRAWYLACARAGIAPGFSFHGLRHTWASWHIMAGTPPEVLKEMGGWADLKMVMRYSHLAPGYVAGYADNVSLGA
jgi:integrase